MDSVYEKADMTGKKVLCSANKQASLIIPVFDKKKGYWFIKNKGDK